MKLFVVTNAIASFIVTMMYGLGISTVALFPTFFFLTHFKRHELPNVMRILLGSLGGALMASNSLLISVGALLVLFGIVLNDEPIRHIIRNRGVIVIAGFDGSGKTTQARWLYTQIRNQGLPCSLIPFSMQTFVHSFSKAKAIVLREQTDPNKRGYLSQLRPYVALLNNFLQYLLQVVPKVWSDEFVICDRFIWQAYIKHKGIGYETRFMYFLSTLIRPECLVFLDAPYDLVASRIEQRGYHPPYSRKTYNRERAEFRRIVEKLSGTIIQVETKCACLVNAEVIPVFAGCSSKFLKEVVA